ncbi:Oidioi.mRNA.OKI2018_I69.chr1.g896.t1.cds [Oikopleura dioica]|uniref:Oidioi.mRNA.OKI2018_I69.chr1.g896.t1.cds n=1 Tax=Oikopleura dioica TaxID=34765 RepID=A0ABN7SQI7_OIKDI|nr:Oidioi.mRNA.OKI2018_I69.chr1.g896.t1.cds [Oikopleura dioica]
MRKILVLKILLHFFKVEAWIAEKSYKENPCYSKNNCKPEEVCVPEGQSLYQCCDVGWDYDEFEKCRSGIAHPCLDQHPCQEDEVCQQKIKTNEISHDFDCVKKDEKCLGTVVCEEYHLGSCSANHPENRTRIPVRSLGDCYNLCDQRDDCLGFDIDEKGGCFLANQDCLEGNSTLVQDDGLEGWSKYECPWGWWCYYMDLSSYKPINRKLRIQYIYYPMKKCKAPERSEECSKDLLKDLDDHMKQGNVMLSIEPSVKELAGIYGEIQTLETSFADQANGYINVLVGLSVLLLLIKIVGMILKATKTDEIIIEKLPTKQIL